LERHRKRSFIERSLSGPTHDGSRQDASGAMVCTVLAEWLAARALQAHLCDGAPRTGDQSILANGLKSPRYGLRVPDDRDHRFQMIVIAVSRRL
jgi:hypothetical protein